MAQNNPNSRFDRLRSLINRKPTQEIPLEPPRQPAPNQYPNRQPTPAMHRMEPGRSYRPDQLPRPPEAQPSRTEQRPPQPEQYRQPEQRQPTERREQPRPQARQQQRQPTAAQPPTPTAPPPPPGQKSATYHQVETILEEGLEESWRTMNPQEQQMFKLEGEVTTSLISDLIATAKATAEAVLDLIKNWLKLIPRVNTFFLEQQGKIKTDKIITLTQTQNNQIQPPLSTKNSGASGPGPAGGQGIEIEKG